MASRKKTQSTYSPNRPFTSDRQETAAKQLAKVIRALEKEHRARLRELRKSAGENRKSGQLVWHRILSAHATLGGSRGAKGVRERRRQLSYSTLKKLPPGKRRRRLETLFRESKVRMPATKAKWAMNNLDIIKDMGGPRKAKARLESLKAPSEFIAWWKQFAGIGDKYARDIMMSLHHPKFRNVVAVDARLTQILSQLGLDLRPYPEAEQFFRRAAHLADVDAWTLDRILYNFTEEAKNGLSSTAPSTNTRRIAKAVFSIVRGGNATVADIKSVLDKYI